MNGFVRLTAQKDINVYSENYWSTEPDCLPHYSTPKDCAYRCICEDDINNKSRSINKDKEAFLDGAGIVTCALDEWYLPLF